jgi:hypothetical protein
MEHFVSYDGGTRQVLFAEEKLKDPDHAHLMDCWPFWIFSSTCILPENHPEYTNLPCSQEDFKRIIHSFNLKSSVAQGQSIIISTSINFIDYDVIDIFMLYHKMMQDKKESEKLEYATFSEGLTTPNSFINSTNFQLLSTWYNYLYKGKQFSDELFRFFFNDFFDLILTVIRIIIKEIYPLKLLKLSLGVDKSDVPFLGGYYYYLVTQMFSIFTIKKIHTY